MKLDAFKIGFEEDKACPNCGSESGRKLDKDLVAELAHRFFVRGTVYKTHFGAAPVVQFNEHQATCIDVSEWLRDDVKTLEKAIQVGFFYYGPRLWMVGEIEPLKALENAAQGDSAIHRITSEYPCRTLPAGELFYRLRKDPSAAAAFKEYDSPPSEYRGKGRLDSAGLPVMYGSQDLEVCVHECRVTVEDELFVATLAPTRDLNLLDLTELLQEDTTEFESLDIAVHMLFLAGDHAYDICREIALHVRSAGFDGIVYPSYFSLVRTGAMPFDTIYGISIRRIASLSGRAKAQVIPNVALFGRPIEDGTVTVKCINRLVLNRVTYDLQFGPVEY